MMHTPKLRALRVAALPPLQGATPVARQSRFHGVPRLDHFMRDVCGQARWSH